MTGLEIGLGIAVMVLVVIIIWGIKLTKIYNKFHEDELAVQKTLLTQAMDKAETLKTLYTGVIQDKEELIRKHSILMAKAVKEARKDASKRATSIGKGQAMENIIPLLGDFEYNFTDTKFVGAPVDYIIFNGLSNGHCNEILFYEIKTGGSQLSKREREIKDCIVRGDVYYIKANVDSDGKIISHEMRINDME